MQQAVNYVKHCWVVEDATWLFHRAFIKDLNKNIEREQGCLQ